MARNDPKALVSSLLKIEGGGQHTHRYNDFFAPGGEFPQVLFRYW